MSCGAHVGGTANADDLWTIEQAVETDLPPLVRHASAVGLLLLKSAAYRDRGANSPITSKDLSDIASLLATRPILPDEVSAAELTAKKRLADSCRSLVESPRVVAAIRSHIAAREPLFDGVDDLVVERMNRIASAWVGGRGSLEINDPPGLCVSFSRKPARASKRVSDRRAL